MSININGKTHVLQMTTILSSRDMIEYVVVAPRAYLM
jgi:hypothetical protein